MIQAPHVQLTPSARQRALNTRVAAVSVQGVGRTNNEDAVSTLDDNHILLVADGIGGAAAGELASATAIEAIGRQLTHTATRRLSGELVGDPATLINAAMSQANRAIVNLSRQPEHRGAGCTIVAAVLDGSLLHVQSAGDSRAYLIRESVIEQLTVDDSFTQMLVSCRLVRPEDARTHPRRNVLLRALGQHDFTPNPHVVTRQLQPGDRVLLCTDGLSDFIENNNIQAIVSDSDSPQEAADRLTRSAQDAGSQDDVTCLVAFIES